jgi:hypothetical protein
MDIANRWADGEDAFHNKRARSPKRIVSSAATIKGEGTATLMTMKDPVRWLLVSEVTIVEGMSTAVAGTATTIEMHPVLASQHIGLDPREMTIKHQSRYLMDLAICTFISTQKERGDQIIS